jgi:hypothetical protein
MFRKLTIAAVPALMFALATFSTNDSASHAFAKGGRAGHNGRPGFSQSHRGFNRNFRHEYGYAWNRYAWGYANYGSYGYQVPVRESSAAEPVVAAPVGPVCQTCEPVVSVPVQPVCQTCEPAVVAPVEPVCSTCQSSSGTYAPSDGPTYRGGYGHSPHDDRDHGRFQGRNVQHNGGRRR